LTQDFRAKASLAGTPPGSGAAPPSQSTSPAPSPTPSAHTGGTTFADVLASIRGSRSGTPEQFATLTALIARKLGVPARVVSGFRVPPTHGAVLDAGTYRVTTADAWTWVEIPVRGFGWVVLDPSPGTYAGQTPPSAGVSPSLSPSLAPSQNAQLTHSNNGGHAVAPRSAVPGGTGLSIAAVVAIVLVAVFIALCFVLAILLGRKAMRTRRRRRLTDPRRRLLGAWHESLDLLAEAGVPDLVHATSAEVVASTQSRFGPEPAAEANFLGAAANIAIFSPASQVGTNEADAAWRAQLALSRAVRRRLGWRARLRARLSYHRAHH
jgi:hypothetical protein